MPMDLPNWYVTQWRSGAIHLYQRQGFTLRNTVMPPAEVRGEKLIFRTIGQATAEDNVGRGEVVKEDNPPISKVELTTSKTRFGVFIDEDEIPQVDNISPGLMQNLSMAGAKAMGRSHDDKIMTEMDTNNSGVTVGAYTAAIDPAVIMRAKQQLMANNVDVTDGEVYMPLDSVSWHVCMGFKQFANSDWVGPDMPFVKSGLAKTWNGVHLFVPSDDLFPRGADNTEIKTFMWHKSAFGFGSLYPEGMRSSASWIEERSGWLHTLRHRYGAKTIQNPGIIPVQGDYDPTLITLTA